MIFVDDAAAVTKVLFCSGKVYYDLADKQQKETGKTWPLSGWNNCTRCRMKQLDALYKKYNKATWFWVQEEPLNMGAASFLQMNLKSINYGIISRQPSASTASGFSKVHAQEQAEIIDTAFEV